MADPDLAKTIDEIRRFNRFYTRRLGVLNEALLESSYSLPEARIIYELSSRGGSTATELRRELDLDAGYLSRLLKELHNRDIIIKTGSTEDARQTIVKLSPKGKAEFDKLDRSSRAQIQALLAKHTPADQGRILNAIKTIEGLFVDEAPDRDRSYILRSPNPGDLGWVVEINGRVYAEEYKWDQTYEALIAQIVADFVTNFDPQKERCWIAEKDGENVGSVFLVKKSATVAKLRVLIVDPKARGLGIGKRLVDECTRFARLAGYKKITLWTNSVLLAARKIYENAGYKMVKAENNQMFGQDLISETWELDL